MPDRSSSIGVAAGLFVIAAGGLLTYSALTGQGITEVFEGAGRKLNPAGGTPADLLNTITPDDPTGGGKFPTLSDDFPTADANLRTYDGKPVAGWIVPHLKYARSHGWKGVVTSGYRSDEEQKTACEHVCGNPAGCPGTCAAPGSSNHRGKVWPLGAVDVSDNVNFGRIVADSPHPGRLINDLPADRVHFSQTGH